MQHLDAAGQGILWIVGYGRSAVHGCCPGPGPARGRRRPIDFVISGDVYSVDGDGMGVPPDPKPVSPYATLPQCPLFGTMMVIFTCQLQLVYDSEVKSHLLEYATSAMYFADL